MKPIQKVILWIGIVLVVLTVAYPPWMYTYQAQGAAVARKNAGYHFLTEPPMPERSNARYGVEMDFGRTLLQLLAIAVVTAGAYVTFSPKSPPES